jgi:hypothetical protein
MSPLSIRIRNYTFTLAPRFAEGTVLTLGEAQAMNQLFCENVRNNTDQWVIAELDRAPAGATLSQAQINDLQERIRQYAEAYQFLPRGSNRLRQSAVEVEMIEIVEVLVAEQKLEGEAAEEFRQRLLADPKVQAVARERLTQRQQIAGKALQDIL